MPSYSHLSCWEREQLAVLRAAGHLQSAIVDALGRSVSTVSRELRRNRLASGGYSPRHADGACMERRRRDAVLEQDEKLRRFVMDRLAEGWSPEQIAGWLKQDAEPNLRPLVTDTIYAFIYRASQKADELWRYLLRGLDIDAFDEADLQDAIITLNATPRKCLQNAAPDGPPGTWKRRQNPLFMIPLHFAPESTAWPSVIDRDLPIFGPREVPKAKERGARLAPRS